MNVQKAVLSVTREQRNTEKRIKDIMEKINRRKARIENTKTSLFELEKKKCELENSKQTIFSKVVSIPVVIDYKYNNNALEIDSDHYARSSERTYFPGTEQAIVTKIILQFEKKEKKLYHPNNFTVLLVLNGEIFEKLFMSIDFVLKQSQKKDDYWYQSMDTTAIKTDPQLQKFLTYLSKRF